MSHYDFNEMSNQLNRIEKDINSNFETVGQKYHELSDRLLTLEQIGGNRFPGEMSTRPASPGAAVAKSFKENSEMFFRSRAMTLEVKTPILQSQVGTVMSEGPTPRPSPVKTALVSAIPTRSIQGVSSLVYSRITDIGQLASVQAGEGALKTNAQPTFSSITQNAITVAGYTEMSEQALKTQGELEKVIDVHLTNSVLKALDNTLIDGTAVSAWPFSGLEALATDYTSATYTLLHDAVVEAAANMRTSGYEPDLVCINPMTFLGIALAKDTSGQYLTGAYMGDLPGILHGMRVTFSSNVAAGKALVIDSRYTELLISDLLNVTFGYVNDGFVRNQVTARGEVSVIPVVRDLGAINLVSPKP